MEIERRKSQQIEPKAGLSWRISDQFSPTCVAPAHDLKLACQYHPVAHRETRPAAVQNLFSLGRRLVRAQHYRDLRVSALGEWSSVVARSRFTGFLWIPQLNLSV